MEMNLDTWLAYYRGLPGHTVTVEYDGSHPAWMVTNEAGELIDWWWLYEADKMRDIGAEDADGRRAIGK